MKSGGVVAPAHLPVPPLARLLAWSLIVALLVPFLSSPTGCDSATGWASASSLAWVAGSRACFLPRACRASLGMVQG